MNQPNFCGLSLYKLEMTLLQSIEYMYIIETTNKAFDFTAKT